MKKLIYGTLLLLISSTTVFAASETLILCEGSEGHSTYALEYEKTKDQYFVTRYFGELDGTERISSQVEVSPSFISDEGVIISQQVRPHGEVIFNSFSGSIYIDLGAMGQVTKLNTVIDGNIDVITNLNCKSL